VAVNVSVPPVELAGITIVGLKVSVPPVVVNNTLSKAIVRLLVGITRGFATYLATTEPDPPKKYKSIIFNSPYMMILFVIVWSLQSGCLFSNVKLYVVPVGSAGKLYTTPDTNWSLV